MTPGELKLRLERRFKEVLRLPTLVAEVPDWPDTAGTAVDRACGLSIDIAGHHPARHPSHPRRTVVVIYSPIRVATYIDGLSRPDGEVLVTAIEQLAGMHATFFDPDQSIDHLRQVAEDELFRAEPHLMAAISGWQLASLDRQAG